MLILFSLIINSVFYYCISCVVLLQHLRLTFVLIKESLNSFSTRRLCSCKDEYAHTYDISTY